MTNIQTRHHHSHTLLIDSNFQMDTDLWMIMDCEDIAVAFVVAVETTGDGVGKQL